MDAKFVLVEPVADPEHLEAVAYLTAPPGVEVRRLVGQRQVGKVGLQVAELHGHVLRLDARAGDVHHVEMLRQADEVAEVREVARALAAVEIADGRRAADRDRGEMAAAERDGPLGRTADQLERARRQGDGLLDELRCEPHQHRLLVDLGPGAAEDLASLGQQHPDAVLLEHGERRGV